MSWTISMFPKNESCHRSGYGVLVERAMGENNPIEKLKGELEAFAANCATARSVRAAIEKDGRFSSYADLLK